MSSEQNERALEVESLKAPNRESRLSTKAVLIGVGSIVGLVVAGILISFSKQSTKADSQKKSIVEKSAQATSEISANKSPKQLSDKACRIKPFVEPQPQHPAPAPAGRVVRVKSFVTTHKKIFIVASVIIVLAIAGVAYYLVNKWQLEEELRKKEEEAKRLKPITKLGKQLASDIFRFTREEQTESKRPNSNIK